MEEFNVNMPIYLQIIQKIKQSVASGKLEPGSRVPSVRDLAVKFSVNPNTMQRALSELERDGLMYTERTSGRYITGDGELIKNLRVELARELSKSFTVQMENLGFSRTETQKILMEEV